MSTSTGRRLSPPAIGLICAVAFSAWACGGSTPVAEFDHGDHEVIDVSFRALSTDEALGIPWRVRVLSDSSLIVADFRPPYLHVIERSSGRVAMSFGRAGRGPGEYISQPEIAVTTNSRYPVVAWSWDLARMTRVSLDRFAPQPDSALSVDISGRTNNPISLGDSAVLLSRASDTTAVATVSIRSGVWTMGGNPISYIPSDSLTPLARISLPGELTMCANDDRTLLFRGSRIAGRAEITDITASSVDTLDAPYSFTPFYKWDPEYAGYVAEWTGAQRKGYVDCAGGGNLILALFSGRRSGSFKNAYERLLARYVHVFRWDGTLVRVLRLSEPVFSIAFDAKTGLLYGAVWEPEPSIVVADLTAALP